MIQFTAFFDEETGEKVLAIKDVHWLFATSRFFSEFVF